MHGRVRTERGPNNVSTLQMTSFCNPIETFDGSSIDANMNNLPVGVWLGSWFAHSVSFVKTKSRRPNFTVRRPLQIVNVTNRIPQIEICGEPFSAGRELRGATAWRGVVSGLL